MREMTVHVCQRSPSGLQTRKSKLTEWCDNGPGTVSECGDWKKKEYDVAVNMAARRHATKAEWDQEKNKKKTRQVPHSLRTKKSTRGHVWDLQSPNVYLSDRLQEAQLGGGSGGGAWGGAGGSASQVLVLVLYSTSLGLSGWSFLMTGKGWASVLKTQWSNGRWSSSEKSR